MRPVWTGAISFGLLHVPVKLYTAVRDRALKFEYLHKKDLCPIGYVKVCKNTGKEVPWNEIVKGYQYEKGDYVILSDEDFKRAAVDMAGLITIEEFVHEKEIDPFYYVKPYYVGPDKKSDKVYNLLLEVLRRSRKVGIGKFVLRTKEYAVALKAKNDLLILDTLRLKEEALDAPSEIKAKNVELSEPELQMAIKLIDEMTVPFKTDVLKSDYVENLEEIIDQKIHGETVKVAKTKTGKATPVPDLMNTLRASLESARKQHKNEKAKARK
jgi:DNA end-binding protein Ku